MSNSRDYTRSKMKEESKARQERTPALSFECKEDVLKALKKGNAKEVFWDNIQLLRENDRFFAKNAKMDLRLPVEFKDQFQKLAKETLIPANRLARMALYNQEVVFKEDSVSSEILFELKKIGTNFNQIAKTMNESKGSNSIIEVARINSAMEDLKKIQKELSAIKNQINKLS